MVKQHQMVRERDRAVIKLLGGAAVLGSLKTPFDWHSVISNGLKFRSLESLSDSLNRSPSEVGEMVGIAPSTFLRRKKAAMLDERSSERLARLARVLVLGTEALGSREAAMGWLERPNRAFRSQRPLDLLTTDVGAREVEAVVGRLIYGGYG